MNLSILPLSSQKQKEDSLEKVAGNSLIKCCLASAARRLTLVSGNDIDLCIQTHAHHSNAVTSVLFVGRLIVAASLDGSISLINFLFAEVIDRISVPVKCGGVTCISSLITESASCTIIAGTESGRLAKISFSDSTVRRQC
jgi:hypothetical protein